MKAVLAESDLEKIEFVVYSVLLAKYSSKLLPHYTASHSRRRYSSL
jgi:hypothetical protein